MISELGWSCSQIIQLPSLQEEPRDTPHTTAFKKRPRPLLPAICHTAWDASDGYGDEDSRIKNGHCDEPESAEFFHFGETKLSAHVHRLLPMNCEGLSDGTKCACPQEGKHKE